MTERYRERMSRREDGMGGREDGMGGREGGRKVFKRDHWDTRCYALAECIFLSSSVSLTSLFLFLSLYVCSVWHTKRERECAFTLYSAINSTRRL